MSVRKGWTKTLYLLVAVLLGSSLVFGQESRAMPRISSVEPASGQVGAELTALGVDLDQTNVTELRLTDGTNDFKVPITSQTATAIKLIAASAFAAPPRIYNGGVVNAASYALASPISAGTTVAIFGDGFATEKAAADTIPLPTKLGGTEVLVNGTPAPLYFVSPGQVNALVPWEIEENSVPQFAVRVNGVASNTVSVRAAPASPGCFSLTWTGRGQGAVLIAGTASIAAPVGAYPDSRPARPGEYVEIYCAGLGPVTNRPPNGHPAPASPLSEVVLPIEATVGDAPAEIAFTGLAPGFTGLYQVNVKVPKIPGGGGDAVPVTIVVEGRYSNTVTIAVDAQARENAWTIGNGRIAGLQFGDTIPQQDRDLLAQLVNEGAPVIEHLLGAPADVVDLTIDLCGWSYDGTAHRVCIGALPSTFSDLTYFSWYFYHELAGVFWLSNRWGPADGRPNWLNEAVGDLMGTFTMRILTAEGVRPYDARSFPKTLSFLSLPWETREMVGGSSGKAWRGSLAAVFISQTSAHEVLTALVAAQSADAKKGDWRAYTAFRDLKAELYAISNRRQRGISYEEFLRAVSRVFAMPIDGEPAVDWVRKQPVTYTTGTPGTYLYVFVPDPTFPQWLEVAAFTRTTIELAPGILEEVPAASGGVAVRVSDAVGVVWETTLDLSEKDRYGRPKFLWGIEGVNLARPGGYRIEAWGVVDGVETRSPDFYAVSVGCCRIPITTQLLSSLILAGINPDGSISSRPFAAIPGGRFLVNENGAAVWQADAATIPASATVNGTTFSLPLPMSRLAVVQNP